MGDGNRTIRLHVSTKHREDLVSNIMNKVIHRNVNDHSNSKRNIKSLKPEQLREHSSDNLNHSERLRRERALNDAKNKITDKDFDENKEQIQFIEGKEEVLSKIDKNSDTELQSKNENDEKSNNSKNYKQDIIEQTHKSKDINNLLSDNQKEKKIIKLSGKDKSKKEYFNAFGETKKKKKKKLFDDSQNKKSFTLEFADNSFDSVVEEEIERPIQRRAYRTKNKNRSRSAPAVIKNKKVSVFEGMTLSELANNMSIKSNYIVNFIKSLGVSANKNSILSLDESRAIVTEFEQVPFTIDNENFDSIFDIEIDEATAIKRDPIITIMGHIDHGKTTLMDRLRSSNIADKECGGVTQHMGAYKVRNKICNFAAIDTPGHEAFSVMRERGTAATDLVILLISADDSIKKQTIEAIDLIKNNNVPFIVVINKIDKPNANEQKVISDMLKYEIVPESLGGDILCVSISAKTGKNLDELLETIALFSEMMELKYSPNANCVGYIIETTFDKFKSHCATVLPQNGQLHVGDIIVTKSCYCKIKTMISDNSMQLKTANASEPIEINGFYGTPIAGQRFAVVKDELEAKKIVAHYQELCNKENEEKITEDSFGDSESNLINLIIKADTDGTANSISGMLNKTATQDIKINIVKSSIGNINESDVILAEVSNAMIFAFNSQFSSPYVESLTRQKDVKVMKCNVIYQIIDYIKEKIDSMTQTAAHRIDTGSGFVKQVFTLDKIGQVIGCRIEDGLIKKGHMIEFYKKDTNDIVGAAKIISIKHYAEECEQTSVGMDFGLNIDKKLPITVGDTMKTFIVENK